VRAPVLLRRLVESSSGVRKGGPAAAARDEPRSLRPRLPSLYEPFADAPFTGPAVVRPWAESLEERTQGDATWDSSPLRAQPSIKPPAARTTSEARTALGAPTSPVEPGEGEPAKALRPAEQSPADLGESRGPAAAREPLEPAQEAGTHAEGTAPQPAPLPVPHRRLQARREDAEDATQAVSPTEQRRIRRSDGAQQDASPFTEETGPIDEALEEPDGRRAGEPREGRFRPRPSNSALEAASAFAASSAAPQQPGNYEARRAQGLPSEEEGMRVSVSLVGARAGAGRGADHPYREASEGRTPPAPRVEVRIGRVEVRLAPPDAPSAAVSRGAPPASRRGAEPGRKGGPAMSLDEYLKRRDGAGS
jgi:hypothetical protein